MSDVSLKEKDRNYSSIELEKLDSGDLFLRKNISVPLMDPSSKHDMVDRSENEIITPSFKSILASSWRYSKS